MKDTKEFQSTLPAWGETSGRHGLAFQAAFQSTLPAWGETELTDGQKTQARFQSTLPAWGETNSLSQAGMFLRNFNPLSPHGERPARPLI